MNKGISFYFGYNVQPKLRTQLIKLAGFDCVITSADKQLDKQNSNINNQVKLFKKNNLKHSSLHMRYKKIDLPNFWLDNEIGDKVEKDIIKDVKIAYKYKFSCVVVHIAGEKTTQIGFNRLERILNVCQKLNVPLAIENLNNQNILLETFKNIKNDYLRFCYDSGHNNLFDPDFDYLTYFKDKLITLHLHDNIGNRRSAVFTKSCGKDYNKDMHTLNKYGNIDWDKIAKKLALCKNEINLDYEILMNARKDETPLDVLSTVYNQAVELEKKIEKYKSKTNK